MSYPSPATMQKTTTEPASAQAGKHSPQSVSLATSEARTKDEKNRTMKTQPWLEGGGLAMLYLLPLIAIFLAPEQNGFYHQIMPVTSLTRGALIDLLVVGFCKILGQEFDMLALLNLSTNASNEHDSCDSCKDKGDSDKYAIS